MIDFDTILDSVGGFGRYQVAVTIAIYIFGIPSGLNAIASVFIAYFPDFRCRMSPFDNSTLYGEAEWQTIMNVTTPMDENGEAVDACVRYDYETTSCTDGSFACVNQSPPTVKCDGGYIYDDTIFTRTAVTEFDLVCDQRILESVAGASYMAGFFFGALSLGILSDKFGRRISTIVSTTLLLVSMLGLSFSNSVALYITCRFLVAFFAMGTNICIFVHLMEIVGVKWRTWIGFGYQTAFAVGYMFWSAIAYIWRDWHDMQLAVLVMSIPFGIITFFLPESPRWLFSTGKDEQGKEACARMARWNKTKLDDNIWENAEKSGQEKQNSIDSSKTYSTVDLFRHPALRILTLKVGFNWIVNSMVYYGISLNAGSLAGDIFINNILAGVLEIGSYMFCALTMDYIGRKLLLTITLMGAGIGLIISTIVNEYADGQDSLIIVGVAFAFVGKAFISGSFAVIYNFTSELYPTVIRSNGIGFGSMTARIGSILSPFIIGLQDYVTWLPNSILGAFAVVGGLLSLTFRDTTGHDMMETIEEAELFHSRKSIERERTIEEHSYDNVIEDDPKRVTML